VIPRYYIEFRRSAEKELGKLDGRTRARVVRAIVALADDPRPQGVKALTGEAGHGASGSATTAFSTKSTTPN
jgi:mRNA-degrading endonuclease RelE of RelBE toxin-antitoxin system